MLSLFAIRESSLEWNMYKYYKFFTIFFNHKKNYFLFTTSFA